MGFTARRLNIFHNGSDGIKPQGTGGAVLVESCYLHRLGYVMPFQSADHDIHADGVQTVGGENITFRYNYINLRKKYNDGEYPEFSGEQCTYNPNAAFILNEQAVNNYIIDANWLYSESAYTIYGNKNVYIRNNRFGEDGLGASSYVIAYADLISEWYGNVWDLSEKECFIDLYSN